MPKVLHQNSSHAEKTKTTEFECETCILKVKVQFQDKALKLIMDFLVSSWDQQRKHLFNYHQKQNMGLTKNQVCPIWGFEWNLTVNH